MLRRTGLWWVEKIGHRGLDIREKRVPIIPRPETRDPRPETRDPRPETRDPSCRG